MTEAVLDASVVLKWFAQAPERRQPDSRLLLLITPGAAGHEAIFAELGEPATVRTLPPPPEGPPDAERLTAIAASHGTRILGPPPGTGTAM